jgi:hypothetical protein
MGEAGQGDKKWADGSSVRRRDWDLTIVKERATTAYMGLSLLSSAGQVEVV